jgi:hypothetical protein
MNTRHLAILTGLPAALKLPEGKKPVFETK